MPEVKNVRKLAKVAMLQASIPASLSGAGMNDAAMNTTHAAMCAISNVFISVCSFFDFSLKQTPRPVSGGGDEFKHI